MNRCEHYGMKQGDLEMYCEPQGNLFEYMRRSGRISTSAACGFSANSEVMCRSCMSWAHVCHAHALPGTHENMLPECESFGGGVPPCVEQRYHSASRELAPADIAEAVCSHRSIENQLRRVARCQHERRCHAREAEGN